MKLLTLRTHYEGELFPMSFLSAGFLRNGIRGDRTPVQGVYVGVTLPWRVWREFYDWGTGRDVASWCRYWGLCALRRSKRGRWDIWHHFIPREIG